MELHRLAPADGLPLLLSHWWTGLCKLPLIQRSQDRFWGVLKVIFAIDVPYLGGVEGADGSNFDELRSAFPEESVGWACPEALR